MTWVKVCGLKKRQHVETAVAAGADAVGFVLAESPRQISPEAARELGSGLAVRRYAVTVDTPAERLLELAARSEVDGVQPHGAHALEAATAAAGAGYSVLLPVRASNWARADELPQEFLVLFDTPHRTLHGGTGRTFDWAAIPHLQRDFVLAGGLGPHNVEEALDTVAAWGVDASSGLESAPGVKDPDLIRRFLEKAKRHEARTTR